MKEEEKEILTNGWQSTSPKDSSTDTTNKELELIFFERDEICICNFSNSTYLTTNAQNSKDQRQEFRVADIFATSGRIGGVGANTWTVRIANHITALINFIVSHISSLKAIICFRKNKLGINSLKQNIQLQHRVT